jgi:hypothetical protein
MKKIKLMTDYFSWPLWHVGDGQAGDIDLNTLPISEGLIKRLSDWQDTYDAILNMDDPASSGFNSPEEEMLFEQEGKRLLKDLQEELGENYEVIWGNPDLGSLVKD